ncbi:hypothetical protein FOMPIDRAFT_92813 [Fomitopsis schrenkii]|uniref:Uncharacterized protein n=1 Tax=Fomitopsis schrenkii TaxID=2126942 RepID=S8DRE6_FOMSC|nr:hypothetical protein FOMPIDRAFT_92813 [Fomitopsis schrenkii]
MSPKPFTNDLPPSELGDAEPRVVKKEEDDDGEDTEILAAQIRAMQERLERVRTKRIRLGQGRIIKRENSPIQVGGFHGGVIDLTED